MNKAQAAIASIASQKMLLKGLAWQPYFCDGFPLRKRQAPAL
jgi:hypothetical protein